MDLAEELRACLTTLFASAVIEIREPTGRTTPTTPVSWEVRGATDKPLLHMWAENCNVTRRVLAIADHSDSRVTLSVERFGRSAPERVEIVRLDFTRNAKQISREDFCEQLQRILAEQFPDETVEKLSVAADLEHTLSRMFARGITRNGAMRGAFLAVPEREPQDAIESSLTYALLWLERVRQSCGRANISFLRLILPEGKAPLLLHQLAALDRRLMIQIYELNSRSETMERVDPCANGNIESALVPLRECQQLLDRAKDDLGRIIASAPEAIRAHPVARDQEVLLRFRGLPFLRWREGRIDFGIGPVWRELHPRTEHELQQLIANLKRFRNPLAPNSRHSLYRAQPESWMQQIIMQDIARVDVQLDPQHVYEQVIAKSHGQHGVLDLLAVTKSKRLVILELKAAENPALPLQAADYWERIRRHHAQGDLARYGYFAGLRLQPEVPIVYLVAPALRFHPTTETILRYLSPEVRVIRVGLAESWRRGSHVVMRQ
jgi:hypothetical protein